MISRGQPGQRVVTVQKRHLLAVVIVVAGALVGLVLFVAVSRSVSSSNEESVRDPAADSVSWHAAPRFDIAIGGRPYLGSWGAPVTIVEFIDFGCPVCRRHAADVLPALIDTFSTDLVYVARHFPIPALTPNAMLAAVAAECAHAQGLFWVYKSALQQDAAGFDEQRLTDHAADVGLDRRAFVDCLGSPDARGAVERDILDAWDHGVTGTPTFFINGRRFRGARSLEELSAYVRFAGR